MVMQRRNRRRAGPKKRTYRPRARVPRRRIDPTMRTFTECLSAGQIYTNSGGVFKCRITDVPQHADYAALYSQFCIRKLKVVMLPKYGMAEPNAALVGITAVDVQTSRLAFAINDSPGKVAPANELDVLTDNGAKVVVGTKKITITCYPKPDLGNFDLNSQTNVAVRSRALKWLNFNNAETAFNGEAIQHGGISWWLTNNSALAQFPAYDVYFYVTFSVRDAV